jgi:hypothetical protein
MSAIAAADESLPARWSANAPDWNAAISARIPTFRTTIEISSSISPKPSSLEARERTRSLSARGRGCLRSC